MIDSDGNTYLTDGSLIEMNNITTGSNNSTLREVNVKPYGFDKTHINKYLKENNLTPAKFYSILVNEIHPFDDGNGRTCKMLFGNENKVINETKIKTNNIKWIFVILNTHCVFLIMLIMILKQVWNYSTCRPFTKNIELKNHTRVKKVGQTSEFLFSNYSWTWKKQ